MSNEEHPISHRRAFLIHIRPDADFPTGRFSGRAEHVASGQVTHFEGADQLWTFVSRILIDLAAQPTTETTSGGSSPPRTRLIIPCNESFAKGRDHVR